MANLGYVRVSTVHQSGDAQVAELLKAGVAERDIFRDVISGASTATERPAMARLLEYARTGDTVVVWRIDRLGRSLIDVVNTVHTLTDRGITVRSIADGIDPTTAAGRLMLHLLSSLAEYERELITERVRSGVTAAKDRGVKFGRPPAATPEEMDKARALRELVRTQKLTVTTAGRMLGWSRSTAYRRLQELREAESATSTV